MRYLVLYITADDWDNCTTMGDDPVGLLTKIKRARAHSYQMATDLVQQMAFDEFNATVDDDEKLANHKAVTIDPLGPGRGMTQVCGEVIGYYSFLEGDE